MPKSAKSEIKNAYFWFAMIVLGGCFLACFGVPSDVLAVLSFAGFVVALDKRRSAPQKSRENKFLFASAEWYFLLTTIVFSTATALLLGMNLDFGFKDGGVFVDWYARGWLVFALICWLFCFLPLLFSVCEFIDKKIEPPDEDQEVGAKINARELMGEIMASTLMPLLFGGIAINACGEGGNLYVAVGILIIGCIMLKLKLPGQFGFGPDFN